jgi:hypothetical protein
MENLLQTGKTEPDQFYSYLRKESDAQKINLGIELNSRTCQLRDIVISEAVNSLIHELAHRTSSETFAITGIKPKFIIGIDSIRPIDPDKPKLDGLPNGWIDSNLILACMHLSPRQSGIKVGWSIDIHQQKNRKPIYKPFNKALDYLARWRKETEEGVKLVAFFPLFQNNNHFSLLEINDRDKCLYHYDSLPATDQSHIKVS